MITVNANYEGDPGLSPRHGADLHRRTGGRRHGTARVRRSDPEHPDQHPGDRAHRVGLRADLHGLEHHPADAPRRSESHDLGISRSRGTRQRTLSERSARSSVQLRGPCECGMLGQPTPSSIPVHPLTDNPTTCTGESLVTTLEVQTYADPSHVSRRQSEYPETVGCDLEVFTPVLYASPTTNETDAPSGLNIDLSAPQFLGFAASPSELRKAVVTLPEGFTINPDAADGQTMCTRSRGQLRLGGARTLSRQRQDRHVLDRDQSPERTARRRRVHRRTEARRPVQALRDRVRVRHQREVRRLDQTRPDDRTAHGVLRRPAPGSVRRLPAPPLRFRSRSDGDPDRRAPSTRPKPCSIPGTRRSPNRDRARPSVSNPVPTGPPVRAGSDRSTRAWLPEPPTPTRAASAPSR